MKKLTVFIFALACLLCTCENEYVIALLRGPSELSTLEIDVYNAEGNRLEGGASLVPGFSSSRYDYTVYIPYEAVYFVINAGVRGEGTVTWLSEDEEEGNTFTLPADMESKQIIVRGERDYMDIADYRLNVMRGPETPRGISLSVMPSVGAFFLKPDMQTVVLEVDAAAPADGGELTYQWFRNNDNNNRTGEKIPGATNKTYELTDTEKALSGTMYYYAELTNNLNGQSNKIESMTRSVRFIDKQELVDNKELNTKSLSMTDIPAGNVDISDNWTSGAAGYYPAPWTTPGFKMGTYEVTWELWKLVFEAAETGGYSFSNSGNQGAETTDNALISTTIMNPQPVGNKIHPVTMVSWRDCVVWCNAYSEMEGLQTVYVDAEGKALRDSRKPVEFETPNYDNNGYRLPTMAEWEYAARGAEPGSGKWNFDYIGGDEPDTYYWYHKPETQEVGKMLPNSAGLYDMGGNVSELVTLPGSKAAALGQAFDYHNGNNGYACILLNDLNFVQISFTGDSKFNGAPSLNIYLTQGFRIIRANED